MPSTTNKQRADGAEDSVLTPGTESADFVSAALAKDDNATRLATRRLFQSGDYSDIKLADTLRRIYACLIDPKFDQHPHRETLINSISEKLETLQQQKATLALLDTALYHEVRAQHLADLEEATTTEGLHKWMQASTPKANEQELTKTEKPGFKLWLKRKLGVPTEKTSVATEQEPTLPSPNNSL